MFKPNRKFKKDYDRLYQQDPLQANILFLLCELANERGEIEMSSVDELITLAEARFNDPSEYAL
jgi:tRNA splicing endonuclease